MKPYQVAGPSSSGEHDEAIQAKIDQFRGISEAFAKDITPFMQMYEGFREAEYRNLATEVPDDYEHLDNTSNAVFHWNYMSGRLLEKLGAPLVTVRDEGDRDRRIRYPGEECARYALRSNNPVHTIIRMISEHSQPGFELLCTRNPFGSYPAADMFSPKNRLSYHFIHGVEALKEHDLLERHFLFSALEAGVLQLQAQNDMPADINSGIKLNLEEYRSLVLYQSLREAGHRPLGPEEVYGIMSSAILSHLELNPEDDFRNHPVE